MEDVTRQAETSLSKFSYALGQLEHTIRPVLKAIDELRASGNEDDLDPMSRARMHISLCYAVNALFCMYLRTQGVDPETHPVSDDIARVQDAFMRMRKVEAGVTADHQPAPDRDRRRHMINAKKSAQKLASLVFPEEVDLLNAMRGKKRKKEVMTEGKNKKMRTGEKSSVLTSESESDSSDVEEDHATRKSRQKAANLSSKGNKRGDDISKNQDASHDSTDSSSEEERGAEELESLKLQKREETQSSGEDSSAKKKKKKKKKKDKSKIKHSSADRKKKRSKDKKDKDRTPKETKRSEEKRKRRRKAQE